MLASFKMGEYKLEEHDMIQRIIYAVKATCSKYYGYSTLFLYQTGQQNHNSVDAAIDVFMLMNTSVVAFMPMIATTLIITMAYKTN